MPRTVLVLALLAVTFATYADTEYRVPDDPDIVHLLTATQTPGGLFNARTGRIAFVYRETLVPVARIARPHLGLAGYWIDPEIRTSDYESRAERVVVLDARTGAMVGTWAPDGEPALDNIDFSPDGRYLSAVTFRDHAPRLALFDLETGRERVLPVAVNPAFGAPCNWKDETRLLCRIVTDEAAAPPTPFASPNIMDHPGGQARTRTYDNLLDNAWEEAAFEYYFGATLAVVDVEGDVRRIEGTTGLLARVQLSPDRQRALVMRLQRPYSHFLKADYFPRNVEIWDLEHGRRIEAPALPQEQDITPTKGKPLRTFLWQYGTEAIGWTEPTGAGGERWVALDAPFDGLPREVVAHVDGISNFGWTNLGTPLFSQLSDHGTHIRMFIVGSDRAPKLAWEGGVKDMYQNPGRAIRTNVNSGPILEYKRHMFLASDGLGADGPRPYLDALNLDTLAITRIATAPEGVYERAVGIVDTETRTFLTVRESETDAPKLFVTGPDRHTQIGGLSDPYPELQGVERKNVRFARADGVQLNGMLYLPRNRDPSKPLPTLVWIYPAEFSDEAYAEQMDSKRFRFHQIREASPIAAVLHGYALLLNPTVPIIGEGEGANDAYIPQLVSSMQAAIDYLVKNGISDRDRLAVAGRSYGAFSTANLLAHSDLFRTGIAISGAYNRTLTPFGFQHERRSFWEATDFYTRMSPFNVADQVNEPLLIMHGGADDNPGTPTLQAQRFFHALVGNGARVRYVELPYERHHYRARENVLHTSAEMLDWLDQTIGPKANATQ